MSSYRVVFDELNWETPVKGLRFKVLRHEGRQLRLVEYTKEMELHWCEKGHVGYMLEGQFEIRFDHETQIYAAGDGVFIPAGAQHKHMARALTDIVRTVFVEEI